MKNLYISGSPTKSDAEDQQFQIAAKENILIIEEWHRITLFCLILKNICRVMIQ